MSAHLDERRGHFVIDLPDFDPVIPSRVIGVDLGPVLTLDVSAAHLTPDLAREFAAALTWWADRKHGKPGDEDRRVTEACDLLELLAESPP